MSRSKKTKTDIVVKKKKSNNQTGIVSIEIEKENDIVNRAVLVLESDKALIPQDTSKEEVKERLLSYITDWAEATRDRRRVSGRGNKKFLMPQNYMFQPSNSKSIEDMEYELDNNRLSDSEGRGIGDAMLNHLYIYGRKTIDELVDDLKAIDRNLLIMGVNDLINKCWLRTVKEKDENGKKIV